MSENEYRYAGFWIRFLALLIDSVLLSVALFPLVFIFAPQLVQASTEWTLNVAFNLLWLVIVILFWRLLSATPGKLLLGIRIVDTRGHERLSVLKCIGRYLAYLVAFLPLCLGFLWVAFDKRKQGWHDKLAGTLVVYKER